MNPLFKYIFNNLGIDLGTANTIIYDDKKGYVVDQPSFIAFNRQSNVIAFGMRAKEMLGKTGEMIRVIRPLADGVIADFVAGEEMVKAFIRSAAVPRYRIGSVIMGVPTGITAVEKIAVIESGEQAGAREVYLIAEPMAAAIGVGLNVMGKQAHMIVDIGGGTTDIAVIAYGGIVIDSTIRIAGDEMNEAIVRYFKTKYHLRIGESTAERLKIEYGTVHEKYNSKAVIVKGLDVQSGLPRQLMISNSIFIEALKDIVEIVVTAIINALEKLPPDLIADIMERGVILTGGGALLKGLDELIASRIMIPVHVADNALYTVAEGTRKILNDFNFYKRILMKR
jgi:rod shape-determining protein MreB and related proteins